MHITKQHPDVQLHVFKIQRDCVTNTTACNHCGRIFDTMSAMGRHITMKLCQDFDPSVEASTLLHAYPELDEMIRGRDCEGLIQHENLMRILASHCAICQQQFKHRGNLIHHIKTRHAALEQQAQARAMELESTMRGPERKCLCFPAPSQGAQITQMHCTSSDRSFGTLLSTAGFSS